MTTEMEDDPLSTLMHYGNRVLRAAIQREDLLLAGKLKAVWIAAYEKSSGFERGLRKQGIGHSLVVDENIGRILIDFDLLEVMKAKDLFVLSATAAIHDIGKVVEAKSNEEPHDSIGKNMLLADSIRLEFGLDRREAEAIAYLIEVHDKGNIDDLPSKPFGIGTPPGLLLKGLASVFRLADMLDTTYKRYSDLVDKFRKRHMEENLVATATRFIGSWDYSPDRKKIVFQITEPHGQDEKLCVLSLVDAMNKELTESHRQWLENCRVLTNENRIVTVSLPTSFGIALKEGSLDPQGLEEFYEHKLADYLDGLHRSVEYVDLGGLGMIGSKSKTLLSKIYIDVRALRVPNHKLPEGLANALEKYKRSRDQERIYDESFEKLKGVRLESEQSLRIRIFEAIL